MHPVSCDVTSHIFPRRVLSWVNTQNLQIVQHLREKWKTLSKFVQVKLASPFLADKQVLAAKKLLVLLSTCVIYRRETHIADNLFLSTSSDLSRPSVAIYCNLVCKHLNVLSRSIKRDVLLFFCIRAIQSYKTHSL